MLRVILFCSWAVLYGTAGAAGVPGFDCFSVPQRCARVETGDFGRRVEVNALPEVAAPRSRGDAAVLGTFRNAPLARPCQLIDNDGIVAKCWGCVRASAACLDNLCHRSHDLTQFSQNTVFIKMIALPQVRFHKACKDE